jgi:hypothetical protein
MQETLPNDEKRDRLLFNKWQISLAVALFVVVAACVMFGAWLYLHKLCAVPLSEKEYLGQYLGRLVSITGDWHALPRSWRGERDDGRRNAVVCFGQERMFFVEPEPDSLPDGSPRMTLTGWLSEYHGHTPGLETYNYRLDAVKLERAE